MLEGLLPRLLPPGMRVRYIEFQGKQDMEKNLNRKLRGWLAPECAFVVLRDQDNGDCREIKQRLLNMCPADPGKPVLVRIACHELESYYLGDLAAVERGLDARGVSRRQRSAPCRDPDSVPNPVQILGTLTGQKYQKVLGSRAIGPHLDTENNTSRSFQALVSGIRRLIATRELPEKRDATGRAHPSH